MYRNKMLHFNRGSSTHSSRFRHVIFHISLCFSGTDRTAAFIFSGSGVDNRFPDVSFAAFPPDALMAARRDHFRRQAAVERIIPLCSQLWKERCKIIEASQNTPACAIRTSGVFHGSGCDDRLPFMAEHTSPPDLFVAVGRHLIRFQTAITLSIPFRSEIWKERKQIIFAGNGSFAAANRASAAAYPAQNACAPRMTVFAAPPHILLTACQHIGWLQGSIFSSIPLCGKCWIHRGKIVITNPQDTLGAVRAFSAVRTDAHLALPCVSVFAAPPHLLMAAAVNLVRCQRCVFCPVPLLEKIHLVLMLAEVLQGEFTFHGITP
mgnify:CR=1 FL=1